MTTNLYTHRPVRMITRILMAMLVLLTLVFVTVSVAAPAVPTGESSLGDRVWNDANNNGTQDVGEVGIIGVKITLYVDDGDGVFDPGPNLTTNDQVDVETFLDGKTTTATNGAVTGYYNYDKITADGNEFFVVIDSTNFDPGGALEGFLFSSGATSAFIMEGVPGSVTDPLRMYVPTALGQFRIVIDTADFGFWKPELSLSITPGSATNKVGDPHTFTITVLERVNNAMVPNVGVKPTVTVRNAANTVVAPTSQTCSTTGTNASGQCTVTINSTVADVYTASANLSETYGTGGVNGTVTIDRTTGTAANATAGGTGTGTKTYVDLRISISPQSATNKVGDAHVFTVLVEQKIGTGAWTAVASGVKPTVVLSATPDSKTDLCTSPAAGTVGATGACTVTINHNSAGVFTANASVTLSVSGQSITRNTTGDTANAAALLETPARTGTGTKTYVDLRISISPLTATNPVGAPHVFTVLVEQQIGTGIWTTVANGVQPAVTVSPTPNSKTDLCATTGTASGACIVTINHNFAATFTTNASVTVSVSGQSITRNTTGDTRNATALLQSPARTGTATKIYQAATLGDSVWWDIDKDGTQDSGEPGIPAVTVNLYVGASTTVYSTTQTNGSGIYQFQNLPNNSYRIEIPASEFSGSETLVSWFGSPLNTGGNTASTDLVDSDADPATHIISSVALGVGVTDNSNDFGFYKNTDYTITKTTNASGAQRLGDVISFTIQIHNNGTSYLAIAPLEDTYNKDFLEYVSASVAPNDPTNDGTLNWTNVLSSQLAPNGNFSINIFFKAVGDTTDITKVNPDMPNTRNVARLVLPFADPDGPAGPLGSLEPLTTKSANDIVQIINPTAVALAASQTTVDASSGVVTVGWQTVSETDIAGFNLSRTRGDGVTELVNSQLIPAQNSGQPTGSWYTVLDTQTSRGVTYTYTLQFIMADGRLTNHPLGSVFVGYTLYLPLVIR